MSSIPTDPTTAKVFFTVLNAIEAEVQIQPIALAGVAEIARCTWAFVAPNRFEIRVRVSKHKASGAQVRLYHHPIEDAEPRHRFAWTTSERGLPHLPKQIEMLRVYIRLVDRDQAVRVATKNRLAAVGETA